MGSRHYKEILDKKILYEKILDKIPKFKKVYGSWRLQIYRSTLEAINHLGVQ